MTKFSTVALGNSDAVALYVAFTSRPASHRREVAVKRRPSTAIGVLPATPQIAGDADSITSGAAEIEQSSEFTQSLHGDKQSTHLVVAVAEGAAAQ